MFKLFRSHETGAKKDEAGAEAVAVNQTESEIQKINKTETEIKPDKISVIESLKKVIDIKKSLGQGITPEEAEQATGMELEDLVEFIGAGKIDIKADSRELIDVLQSAMEETEEKADQGLMRKFANNKTTRAAFVALMLMLKFAPSAHGAETKGDDKKGYDTEAHKSFDRNIEPDNTYHATAEDFNTGEKQKNNSDAKAFESKIEDAGRYFQLELASYFDTDSDKIPADSEKQIVKTFEQFLSQITPDNVDELNKALWKVSVSSDQRLTSTWENGNEGLSEARFEKTAGVLKTALDNFDFKTLTPDQVKAIKAHSIVEDMADSKTGPEKGVTYITDLNNPETGEHYTADEEAKIKAENPNLYKQLLDDCRKVTFSISVDKSSELPKIEPKKANLEITPGVIGERPIDIPVVERLTEYKNVSLGFDKSPSVGNSFDYMADIVEGLKLSGLKLNVGEFSDKLETMKAYDNAHDAAEAIRGIEFNGNIEERALKSVHDMLEKMPDGERNLAMAMTDESFQGMSWEDLQELKVLAEKKTADVYFYYADDKNKTVREVSLNDLQEAFKTSLIKEATFKAELIMHQHEAKISAWDKQHSDQTLKMQQLAERDASPLNQQYLEKAEAKASELAIKINLEKGQLENFRSDWESGDLERLFANQQLKQYFDQDLEKSVKGEAVGRVVLELASADKVSK